MIKTQIANPTGAVNGQEDVYKRQVREFSGEKSMREAFEQLIERQTCEHFEEWLEQREMAENRCV